MRKRKIPDNMPTLDFMPEPLELRKWNADSVLALLTERTREISDEEREILVALTMLIRNELLPDDYEKLYRLLSPNATLKHMPGRLPDIAPLSLPDTTATPAPTAPSEDLPFTFDP